MEVILLKDVNALGKTGEVVKVKDGYGTNFLIPHGLAKKIKRNAARFLEDERKRAEIKVKRLKLKAEELKDRLAQLSCTIAMPVGEGERLHGSVTAEMIRQALSEEGIDIDKNKIEVSDHINKLGLYNITVRLHPEVTAAMRLWVVKR